jgi:hypothetical protein
MTNPSLECQTFARRYDVRSNGSESVTSGLAIAVVAIAITSGMQALPRSTRRA